jgi:hypothetical protein
MAAISLKFIGFLPWAHLKRLPCRMEALALVREQGFAVLNF